MLKLTDGFKKWLTLNISDGTTDLNNRDFSICSSRITVKSAFDLVCNMWNNLNGTSTEIATTFFL